MNTEDQRISKIVMEADGPQDGCEALIQHAINKDPNQNASAILIYFPPDFGPWR
jgi:serine/threonine protein phosphatase PrpC